MGSLYGNDELFTKTESPFLNRAGFFFDQDGTLNQWRWISVDVVATPGYFRSVKPHSDVISASAILNKEYPVGTYGAVWRDGHSRLDKNLWMDKHVPHISIDRRFYVPCGTEKASFFEELIGRPISRGDILIDDNSDVLRSWESYGGTGVKCRTPENGRHGTWQGYSFECDMLAEDIASYLLAVREEVGAELFAQAV